MEETHSFKVVVQELGDIYERKNHDYGNSFSRTFAEFGPIAAVVRMNDKMERLKMLCRNEALVNESLRDTAIDLANYAIMLVMELDKRKIYDVIDKV